MRKRKIFIFLAACLLFFCSFDANQQKVYDDAGLLTEAEKEELQKEAVKLSDQIRMDVILVKMCIRDRIPAAPRRLSMAVPPAPGYPLRRGSTRSAKCLPKKWPTRCV